MLYRTYDYMAGLKPPKKIEFVKTLDNLSHSVE